MSESPFRLSRAPIVEAVVDLDCDLPAAHDLGALEPQARSVFEAEYPVVRPQIVQQHELGVQPHGLASHVVRQSIAAFHFLRADERQLVQVRAQGFSFNRLAPYGSLDEYVPEIERTWRGYLQLAQPLQVRRIRLRYINRIMVPMAQEGVAISEYFRIVPVVPDAGNRLRFGGFFNQHVAVDEPTGYQVILVLASQPVVGDQLPVIFDNCVMADVTLEPDGWRAIEAVLQSMRALKNHTFTGMLTERCLNLYR